MLVVCGCQREVVKSELPAVVLQNASGASRARRNFSPSNSPRAAPLSSVPLTSSGSSRTHRFHELEQLRAIVVLPDCRTNFSNDRTQHTWLSLMACDQRSRHLARLTRVANEKTTRRPIQDPTTSDLSPITERNNAMRVLLRLRAPRKHSRMANWTLRSLSRLASMRYAHWRRECREVRKLLQKELFNKFPRS